MDVPATTPPATLTAPWLTLRRSWWLIGLCLLPALAQAQHAVPPQDPVWRQANDWVGQFRRGHADWLKAEAELSPALSGLKTAEQAHALDLRSATAAVDAYCQADPDTREVLNRLSGPQRQALMEGRLEDWDPALGRRIDGLDHVVETLMAVRKAWWQAATSQLSLAPAQTALESADMGRELGQRMVSLGHWSRLNQAPHRLAWAQAQLAVERLRYAAARDRQQLLRMLRVEDPDRSLLWPQALPKADTPMTDRSSFEQRWLRLKSQLPHLQRMRQQAAAELAYQAYEGSRSIERLTAEELLVQMDERLDATLLHYNGMLKSTWDVLEAVRAQAQARIDHLQARRDAAVAALDLQWVLWGGETEGLPTLGGAGDSRPHPSNDHGA